MNGITRKKVIQICTNNNIPVFEKNFSLVDVYSSQEAFITGTLGSLTSVNVIDGRSIGKRGNFPLTKRLNSLYKDLITNE
jgi:branched-chain amino acid aminotransferase